MRLKGFLTKKWKGIPVLALVLGAGIVSAGVLSYYGVIKGTVDVSQSVTIDGHNWNEPITYSDSVTAGDTFTKGMYEIQNNAEQQEVVTIDTTVTSSPGTSDGVSTTYIYDVNSNTEYESGKWHYDALITTAGATELENLNSISFKGKSVGDDSAKLWFEIQLDRDAAEPEGGFAAVEGTKAYAEGMDAQAVGSVPALDNKTWQVRDLSDVDGWDLYLPDGATCKTHATNTGDVIGTDADVCNYNSLADIQEDYPSTVLAKLIEVNSGENVKIKDYTVTGTPAEEGIFLGTTSTNEGHLDFSIQHDFLMTAKPGTYEFETTVAPA